MGPGVWPQGREGLVGSGGGPGGQWDGGGPGGPVHVGHLVFCIKLTFAFSICGLHFFSPHGFLRPPPGSLRCVCLALPVSCVSMALCICTVVAPEPAPSSSPSLCLRTWLAPQWMGSGRPGRCGAAAVSRVGVARSDGSVSARGPSLGEQPARAHRRSSANAVPSGVPVSDLPTPTAGLQEGTRSDWVGLGLSLLGNYFLL